MFVFFPSFWFQGHLKSRHRFLKMPFEELHHALSPSISPVMKHMRCTLKWVQEREQRATAQHEHMAHGPTHYPQRGWGMGGSTSVLMCCDEFLNPNCVCFLFLLFYSRCRNVEMQTARSVELRNWKKKCQRWNNKAGELLTTVDECFSCDCYNSYSALQKYLYLKFFTYFDEGVFGAKVFVPFNCEFEVWEKNPIGVL